MYVCVLQIGRFFCQIKHINFSKWQLKCILYKTSHAAAVLSSMEIYIQFERAVACKHSINGTKIMRWNFDFSHFLWQKQPISIEIKSSMSENVYQRQCRRWRRKKQQHFPLFRLFSDCCMLLYFIYIVVWCWTCCFFVYWLISNAMRSRSIDVVVALCVYACVCENYIESNLLKKCNQSTELWSEHGEQKWDMYVYIEWMNAFIDAICDGNFRLTC